MMGAPQIILIVLYAMSLGTELSKHGEPRTGNHSFWSALVACVIVGLLLVWGGFFT